MTYALAASTMEMFNTILDTTVVNTSVQYVRVMK